MFLLAAALLTLQVTSGGAAPSAPPQAAAAADTTDTTDTTRRARPRRPVRRLPVTPALEASAFKDAAARDLLLRARAARLRQDSALLAYDAKTFQRLSVGMNFRRVGRDRLLLRTETAARVQWSRAAGLWVEPTGRRMTSAFAEMEGDILDEIAPVPYFPGRESLWFPSSDFGAVRAEVDEESMIHPIATGAEAYYRYATGDSVGFTLGDGRRITLRELRITARRPEWKLFVGSFWFDTESAQLVRAAYRMAVDMDIWSVVDEEQERERADARAAGRPADHEDDVPKWVKGMLNPMKATISAITVEYGLHEGRFWMPRSNVAEGNAQAGFMHVPFKFEEGFRYASVNGTDSLPPVPAPLARPDSVSEEEWDDFGGGSINIGTGAPAAVAPDDVKLRQRADSLGRLADSLAAAGDTAEARQTRWRARRAARRLARREARARACATDSTYFAGVNSRHDGALRMAVRMPCDTTRLATSPDLPPSIYDPGEELFGQAERDELVRSLDMGLQAGWAPQAPRLRYGLDLLRYNRVEGFSAALGLEQALGQGYTAEALARLGVADLQPNGELLLRRGNGREQLRVGAFRRLAAANDWGSPLSFGSSLANLLYARDEGFYYRAWGAELAGTRERCCGVSAMVDWRLFAERHDSARVETQFSVGHLLNEKTRFIQNIQAREGTVLGGQVGIHRSFGMDPARLRLVTATRLEAAAGDFDYTRAAFDATLSRGLGRRLAASLTGSAGVSGGDLPAQRLWYLGGLQTVRGQVAGTAAGDSYWMGRAELGIGGLAARPVVFYDVGWAGQGWSRPGRDLLSGAGVGASFLDGLIRVDVARGIQPRQLIRTDIYLEARF